MLTENSTYILSIDIGIKHLAMLLVETSKTYVFKEIVWFELVDITQFVHLDQDSKNKCSLYHTKTISDWLSHVFYLNTELFDLVETILIERQPPHGHVAIEQLIYFNFRNKSVLIHPRSVHKFLNWTNEDTYEIRKQKSVKILKRQLEKGSRTYLLNEFNQLRRQHDISDAYIQALFFLYIKQKEIKKNTPAGRFETLNQLDKYAFNILESDISLQKY
jgi:hypothetical protein